MELTPSGSGLNVLSECVTIIGISSASSNLPKSFFGYLTILSAELMLFTVKFFAMSRFGSPSNNPNPWYKVKTSEWLTHSSSSVRTFCGTFELERFRSMAITSNDSSFANRAAIDFQIINFTRLEGGRRISYTSTTDNAVKLFIWKSIPSFYSISGFGNDICKRIQPVQDSGKIKLRFYMNLKIRLNSNFWLENISLHKTCISSDGT